MTTNVSRFINSGFQVGAVIVLGWAGVSCNQEKGVEEVSVVESDEQTSSPVLARVGGASITAEDLEAELAHRTKQRRPIPEVAVLLDEMIEREALLHRSRETGLDTEPAVRRRVENLLIAELRAREIERELRTVQVSDEELQAAYESRIAEFTRPAKVRVAIIRIGAGSNASDAKRAEVLARITEAREKIIASPAPGGRGPAAQGFGTIAVNYSEEQSSRYRGGDIGWLNAGSFDYPWPRKLLEVAYAGEKGAVSEVLEIEGDFYLAMKTDFREAGVVPIKDAMSALKSDLMKAKRAAIEAGFREETLSLAEPTIDQAALADVKLSIPRGVSGSPGNSNRPPAVPASESN